MRLFEILKDWGQLYVHYSKSSHITINPRPKHRDPVGIYLFPEEFSTIGHWVGHPYKFYVKIKPNTNILDLGTLTEDQINTILDQIPAVKNHYETMLASYPKHTTSEKVDLMWEMLQAHFSLRLGRKQAAFNKLFRDLGYQAIFDDTDSVHIAEVQMIILDPRVIEVQKVEKRGGSGFAEINKVINDIIPLIKNRNLPFEVTKPRKNKDTWSSTSKLSGRIRIGNEEQYLEISVGTDDEQPPTKVLASALYSRPNLNAGFGAEYSILTKDYDNFSNLAQIEQAIDKVFT